MSEPQVKIPVREILKAPHEALSTVCTEVTIEEGREIAAELRKSLSALGWGEKLGLAAPQIGITKRVFIALDQVYINPKIVWTPKAGTKTWQEACYSVEGGALYPKERPYAVSLEWFDEDGERHEGRWNNNVTQRVILHEMDHLEGILCNA